MTSAPSTGAISVTCWVVGHGDHARESDLYLGCLMIRDMAVI